MHDPSLPDFSRDVLVDLGGWAVLKEARALYQAGAVRAVEWQAPLLNAEVGAGPVRFFPRLNLKSLTFAENRCNCIQGKRGQMCPHAIAACIAMQDRSSAEHAQAARQPEAVAEKPTEPGERTITSIRLDASGTPLRLRLLLPPNLEVAAPRNAIMAKLEVAVGRKLTTPEKLMRGAKYALEPPHQKAYALVEEWCQGRPSSLLQLKRSQLRALLDALKGEPAVAWIKRPDAPLEWKDGQISDVHLHLIEAEPSVESTEGEERGETSRGGVQPKRPTAPTPIEVPRRGQRRMVPPSPAVEAMKLEIARQGRPGTLVLVDGSTQFLAIQLPDRDHLLYEPTKKLLLEHDFRSEPSNGKWWLRDRHKTLNFLAAHEGTLRDELGAVFSDSFTQRTAGIKRLEVCTTIEARGDSFALQLSLSAPGLNPSDLHRAIASRQYYILQDTEIYLVAPAQLEKLSRAQQALSGDHHRVLTPHLETRLRSAQLRDAEQILEDLDADVALPEDWRKRSAALARLDRLASPPLLPALDGMLRVYQRIGTAWMWHLHQNELGGILADEMGLGKTVQALGLLSCVTRQSKERRPTLVVCPASLIGNWEREARKFAPELSVFRHHRESRLAEAAWAAEHDIILTSYPTLARDIELLAGVDWEVVLADEAQHIKNRRTQAAKALRQLPAHARFVLTGTPIENSLDDLRSIFAFLLPGYLAPMPPGTTGEDRAWFDRRHREQAAPYILRRTKQFVAPELPEKIEQIIYCELTRRQRTLYEKTQIATERALADLELAGRSESQVRIAALAQLLRLRQVCAEPRLLDESLEATDSAKLEAFAEILNEALDDQHRILVFSQFVSVLSHLRVFLEGLGLPYCYLDGKTRNRLAECDRFNNDASIPVFLISLKAGGTGLNLTGADTVVHFDPWWNPAVEDQATDRAHRIGQTRKVTSYKLITAATVEEKVVALQAEKSALLRDLLDASAAATAKVGLAEIRELIRRA